MAVAFATLVVLAASRPARATPPPEFERTLIAEGLEEPTAFRLMPDGRIFVAEKAGAIKVIENGQVGTTPVITLITLPSDTDAERGLLGIEPDPDFATNGYLYVSYTTAANHDRLSRVTVTGNVADPASEVVLLESDQLGNVFHHGGEVRFGPDGKLYWAMGMNLYNPNSQNLGNLHGKIMRINKDGTIPTDNPFFNTPGARKEIWAYGLRNPFRFDFLPDGRIITGDVGGSLYEEVDIIERGGNYGWPLAEGYCAECPYVNPVYTYAHTPAPDNAGSITAIMRYEGDAWGEEFDGAIFYADYTLNFVKYLHFDHTYTSFIEEHEFDDDAGTPVQLSQGPDGSIYQLNIYPGELYRIGLSDGNRAPVAEASANPIAGLAPLDVNFSSAGSGDPDGTPVTYSWNFGDGATSTEQNPSHRYVTNGEYDAVLTVSDGDKSSTSTVTITVGNRLPTAVITAPTDLANYNAGDVVTFGGNGTDPEDGTLPDSAFSWDIVFHHAEHVHPFLNDIDGVRGGTFTIPRAEDNIASTWYEVRLTVTDAGGLTSTTSVNIHPRLVTLTFNASNPAVQYTVDGIPHTGEYTEQAVVGVERVLGAPSPQYGGGFQYQFGNWSDGGAQSHTIVTPATNATYVANYVQSQLPPSPWTERDIGSRTVAGYSSYNNGTFTVHGAGNDIWGDTDEFHYVHQSFRGDGAIVARVASQDNTDGWAKSGIMIKQSAVEGAPYVLLGVTPAHGMTFQYNFNGDGGSRPYTFPNAWMKLERIGNLFKAYTSPNGTTWTQLAQTSLAMGSDVTAGLFVVSHNNTLNQTVFGDVSITSAQPVWTNVDVGAPALAGSSSLANDVWTVNGGGNDIWADADQFQYNYQPLVGDGQITARVRSQTTSSDGWAKAGVMIKSAPTAGAPYVMLATTPLHGLNMQYNFNQSVGGGGYAFPNAWVRVKRQGNTFTTYRSTDGITWVLVGSATVPMAAAVTAGLFVNSHNGSVLGTATFDHVEVVQNSGLTALPSPWTGGDVGSPGLTGSATHSNGVFTINGAGNDIWQDADQFHYVSQPLNGDGEIIARVTSQEAQTSEWAKSGVMIKQAAVGGSPYALLAITPVHNAVFQHQFVNGTDAGVYSLPHAWLRLTRVGNVITAYKSTNGTAWTQVGTATIAMPTNITIGLFVTSHNGSQLNTSTFANVTVTP
ncbi:PQQ-dependent sugar dehydrogenase [Frankia sp. CNm7]|nr:PQQ-dependent sugar dehydrogenase [Frankia nepalensis]MBL7513169.1 PQQ-dependent sugar dehydrogenase [Frankia nepalensis]MBL7524508.1 PQQ-dependent sugar dehydrogenase [Frankia nepalensis]